MKSPFLLNRVQLRLTPPGPATPDPKAYAKLRDNLSAVLLTSEQQLWLGADEGFTLECLSLETNSSFGQHQHLSVADFIDLPQGKTDEIDIEGLDYSDRYLWLLGSHSYKRRQPKFNKSEPQNLERLEQLEFEANRYLLARIPLVNQQLHKICVDPDNPTRQLTAACLQLSDRGNILIDALAADEHLGPFIQAKIPGKENGFDLEGMVVKQNRIFLGLRGPVLRGWALILELQLEPINSTTLQLQPLGKQNRFYRKHFVNLAGLGIRDLVLDGKDLLILAGPSMDLDGPVQLYRLRQALTALNSNSITATPDYLFDLPYGQGDDHAEGLTFCSSLVGQPALLVVYDTPTSARKLAPNTILADIFALEQPDAPPAERSPANPYPPIQSFPRSPGNRF